MIKKKIQTLIVASAMLFGFGGTAVAGDFISVGASLPLMVTSDGTSADSTAGLIAYVKLPFLGGFGLEAYDFTFEGANGSKSSYGVSMADVFYQFPIPIVNVTLGAGIGNITPKDDAATYYDAGMATQFFGRVGITLGLFDVHVSNHTVSSTVKGNSSAVSDSDINFNTTALGVSIGF